MSTRKEPSNPTRITPKSVFAFAQGYLRKFSDTFGLLEDHKKEQVLWRTEQAKAWMENGTCLYCGCDTPAKFYSDEQCEDPERKCYPEMMSKADWEKYKIDNSITITIKPA